MSVRISLTLEASEMFLSRHMIFSLERAAVVWAILERISGFDPSLEMIAPRYLKFSPLSSLWPFILISLWKPFGLFVITFVLSGPISILYLVVVLSRRSIRTPASSSSSAFTTMSSAKRKLVLSRPPSWSAKASHMILSRKMLKRVGESRNPCRTPTVVLNHSPVLPLNRDCILFAASAFRKLSSIYVFSYFPFGFEGRIWDLIVSVPDHCLSFYLSYRFSMARMMLALMLYFLIVAHKASCHTLSKAFLKSMKTW